MRVNNIRVDFTEGMVRVLLTYDDGTDESVCMTPAQAESMAEDFADAAIVAASDNFASDARAYAAKHGLPIPAGVRMGGDGKLVN